MRGNAPCGRAKFRRCLFRGFRASRLGSKEMALRIDANLTLVLAFFLLTHSMAPMSCELGEYGDSSSTGLDEGQHHRRPTIPSASGSLAGDCFALIRNQCRRGKRTVGYRNPRPSSRYSMRVATRKKCFFKQTCRPSTSVVRSGAHQSMSRANSSVWGTSEKRCMQSQNCVGSLSRV